MHALPSDCALQVLTAAFVVASANIVVTAAGVVLSGVVSSLPVAESSSSAAPLPLPTSASVVVGVVVVVEGTSVGGASRQYLPTSLLEATTHRISGQFRTWYR
jgi:hypothetical protein